MKTNNVIAYISPEMEIVALSQEGTLCGSFGSDDVAPGRDDWWNDKD
ncbi:MAG: hypothetical protein MJY91_04880 [Bacteroidales bacterium]|nr:hypothetical protein [Bacteroidales bacterium]